MVISSPISYIEGMKKVYLSVVLLCIAGMAGAVDFEISTGLGYGLYGISAENYGVKADSYYHSLGLELGAGFLLSDNWVTRVSFFAGLPLGADNYKDGAYYSTLNMSLYDDLTYQLGLYGGFSYRIPVGGVDLFLGSYGVMNNVILTSKTYPGISFYSYTLGAGLSLRGEYPVAENLALYGELKGHINLVELLLSFSH
jgi:hypothetical protein